MCRASRRSGAKYRRRSQQARLAAGAAAHQARLRGRIPFTHACPSRRSASDCKPVSTPIGRAWLDLARKAEAAGFDTLYVADHLGVTASPFAALAAAAGATSTLKLGTYVLNAGIRDPLSLASEAATVDVISNGRFVLGLGAGHTPAEWAMTGRDYPTAALGSGDSRRRWKWCGDCWPGKS